jgi:hypothetical protein
VIGNRNLLAAISMTLALCGCFKFEQQAAPTGAPAEEVWTRCHWIGKTPDGAELYFHLAVQDGVWSVIAKRGSRHFVTEDIKVSASEAAFVAGDSYGAGGGDVSDVVTSLMADYAANKILNKKQTFCLRLQDDRQSASLWAWDSEQNQWVSQDVTLSRSILASK